MGIGPPDPRINPFLRAKLPTLRKILPRGVPVLGGEEADPVVVGDHPPSGQARLIPLDPLMEMEGLPQSGTGQVALLTGENAAAIYGRHFGPWVPVPLRPLMMEGNILTLAKKAGLSCAFANAYPSQFIGRAWVKRPAGPALAAHGAGLLTRTEEELARGEALSSEILNTLWREKLGLTHLPEITPEEAGENLARISESFSVTFFAHYAPDTAGHERAMKPAIAALERLDAFLSGLIPALADDTTLVLASDHGNIEDVTTGHTLNPTFNLLLGPGAEAIRSGLCEITDLSQGLVRYWGVGD